MIRTLPLRTRSVVAVSGCFSRLAAMKWPLFLMPSVNSAYSWKCFSRVRLGHVFHRRLGTDQAKVLHDAFSVCFRNPYVRGLDERAASQVGDGAGHRASAVRRHECRIIRHFRERWKALEQGAAVGALCQHGIDGNAGPRGETVEDIARVARCRFNCKRRHDHVGGVRPEEFESAYRRSG